MPEVRRLSVSTMAHHVAVEAKGWKLSALGRRTAGESSDRRTSKVKQEKLIKQALRYAMVPIILSFIVTPLRFSLELAGLPEVSIFLIGLLWLTLAFAIYWGVKFFNEERPYRLLLLSLVLFAPISRLTVFVAWWVDKKWQLGTHYGLYFETWQQALLNQVVYGALVQIIPGFIVGASTIALMRLKRRIKSADRESK